MGTAFSLQGSGLKLLNCSTRNLVFSSYTDILKFGVFPSQQNLSEKKLQNVEVEREEMGQGASLFVSIFWEPYCWTAHTCGHFLELCNIEASQICSVQTAVCWTCSNWEELIKPWIWPNPLVKEIIPDSGGVRLESLETAISLCLFPFGWHLLDKIHSLKK